MYQFLRFILYITAAFTYFGNCSQDQSTTAVALRDICCIDDDAYEFHKLCTNITCPSHLSKRHTLDKHIMDEALKKYTLVSTTCGNWSCKKSFFSENDKQRITQVYNSLRNDVAGGKLRTSIGTILGVPNMMKMYWKWQLDVDAQTLANECNDHVDTPLKKEEIDNETLMCEIVGTKIKSDDTVTTQKQFIDKLKNYLLNGNIMDDFSERFFTRQLATYFGCGVIMQVPKSSSYIFFVCKFCTKERVMYPIVVYHKPRMECPSYAKDLDSNYPNLCDSKRFESYFDWINSSILTKIVCQIAQMNGSEIHHDEQQHDHMQRIRYLQFDVSRMRFTKTETVFRFFSAHIIYLLSLISVFLFSRNLTSDREESLLDVIGAT